MYKYDPKKAPNPVDWNQLNEQERIALVADSHKHERRLPNVQIHAMFHVVVETQLAMGDELTAAKTLKRLMGDGLDRHEALHAIATVLSHHIFGLMKRDVSAFNQKAYEADLEALTLQKWREMTEDDE